jgi:hypothetical protein
VVTVIRERKLVGLSAFQSREVASQLSIIRAATFSLSGVPSQ